MTGITVTPSRAQRILRNPMSIEAVEPQPARPWARRLATLHTRATTRGLREQATPLAEITEDVLAVGVGMLQELAQQQIECARLRSALKGQVAAWEHLFEVMPTACVLTDESGLIVEANLASSLLFNISAKSLRGRSLVVFFDDRSAFNRLAGEVRSRQAATPARLMVRPREGEPSMVPTVAVPAMTSGGQWMLWFLGGPGDAATGPGDVTEPLAECVATLQQQVSALRMQIETLRFGR